MKAKTIATSLSIFVILMTLHNSALAQRPGMCTQCTLRPALLDESNQQYPSTPSIHSSTVEQSTVPLSLTDTVIHSEPGRQLSELTFKIKNQARSPLREVSLMVV